MAWVWREKLEVFLQSRERSHIKKHIRKLRLIGVITDPYEILNAENKYYENLYKSRSDVSDQNANFHYDDLPVPTLWSEKRVWRRTYWLRRVHWTAEILLIEILKELKICDLLGSNREKLKQLHSGVFKETFKKFYA